MSQGKLSTRQQIMEIAEHLFSTRGYRDVRLRDIADAVGIKHAALYYYAPNGKEQLYVDVMEHSFERHQEGMTSAVEAAAPDLRRQLLAVVEWLLAHPPLNPGRMEQSDFGAISPENAQKLTLKLYDSLRLPLGKALEAAQTRGEIAVSDVHLAALCFITCIESIHNTTNPFLAARKNETAAEIIEMMLTGWLLR
ncbi:MAG: TetR/AcrR family transcriptional regulator [Ardenticatenaceae bacterium]|nr:TetR/AcrR family transcriptional regulator [Ardenticatenaceae bacterium]